MRSSDVDEIAERVLSTTLREAGFESLVIEERQDHSGDDAFYITVTFRPGAGVTRGKVTAEALVTLRDEFEKIGELRFPYLIYNYPDDPPPFADAAE